MEKQQNKKGSVQDKSEQEIASQSLEAKEKEAPSLKRGLRNFLSPKNLKINPKLILGFLVVALLVGVTVYIFLSTSQTKTEERILTVGISQWVSNEEYTANVRGFKDGLAEQGYIEGQNIVLIIENPETDKEKQREIIRSFIDKKVDLVYSLTTPGTLIAKEMIQDKPIVFSIVTYPVEAGVVGSLEASGNNLVGTRNFISVKRQYYQFEKIYPDTKKLAFVHRKGEPNSVIQYNNMKELLNKKGIETIDIAGTDLENLRTKLNNVIDNIDSMYSACDTLIQGGGEEIVINFSRRYKKPSFTCNKDGVNKGALMGNVADFYIIGKMSGNKAGLILGGAEPTSLLTESPGKDYLMVNLKTAQEIRITIPQNVLDDAEEIINK